MIDVNDPDLYGSPVRRRRFLPAMVVVALFGSGAGVGYVLSNVGDPEPPPTTSTVVEIPTAADHGANLGSILELGDEPIADVAAAMLPTLVQIRTTAGVGSGVIYDTEGYILTAGHVLDGSTDVEVKLFDGTVLSGTVVGVDTGNDIGVVLVVADGLQAATLALDDVPRAGQLAVALGSPWGLDSTVTAGIVSAVDRSLTNVDGTDARSMIQTDAAINPGNSGGPLVDRRGRVIGINVSIYTESGASDGVGFAVPIDRAYRVAEALRSGNEFVPGFLGVRGKDSAVGNQAGAMIYEVTPGSAAERAGIEVDDLVTALDARPITGITDLAARIRNRQAGDQVILTLIRDGVERTIQVTLGSN